MEKPRSAYHTLWTVEKYEAKAKWEGECLVYPRNQHHIARKIYQLRHGVLPSTVAVCHKCDNPPCILDKHHFTGTWKDNVQDAVKKRRHSCFKNCQKGKFGKDHVWFGGKQTQEAKKKISEASKDLWKKVKDLGFSTIKEYGKHKRDNLGF